MKTKIKRSELIERLVDIKMDSMDKGQLKYIVQFGYTGFEDMEDYELIEEIKYYRKAGKFEDCSDEIEIID